MQMIPGQKVYVKRVGNAARYKGEYYTEEIVEDVKRKWFTLKNFYRKRFSIENGYNDGRGYSSELIVYESIQEIEEEKEIKAKCSLIQNAFEYGGNRENLPVDTIRKIYDLIYTQGVKNERN
jgi:hypothetical protein